MFLFGCYAWQGQIYSLSGKNPKYKDFYAATGYGTGEGLGGWNCRHSFYPYFEGLSLPASKPDFSEAENLEMYENQQQQRAYERAVRRSKRELAGIDAARSAASDPQLVQKLDKEFARKSVTLKNREERLSQFCRDKGLMPDNARVRVVGFGKSVSAKATWANRKAKIAADKGLTSGAASGKIGDTIYNAAGKPVKIVAGNSLYGEPNIITQVVNKKGGIERNYFDDQGKQKSQVCNNDHGKPKAHPFGEHGEHGHTYTRDKDGKPVHGEARELTKQEREENADIL